MIGSSCDANGIRVLKFSQPQGPVFHYEEATNVTFGDQPHIRDPLDKKYVYVKESTVDLAGEGLYAAKDIPANINFVLSGGYLFNEEQYDMRFQQLKEKSIANSGMTDDPDHHDMETKNDIDLLDDTTAFGR